MEMAATVRRDDGFRERESGQIGRKFRLAGGPSWPCLVQDRIPGARGMPGLGARPGGGRDEPHDLRAGVPAELSTSEVICTDVRISVHGLWAPPVCMVRSCMIAGVRWQ